MSATRAAAPLIALTIVLFLGLSSASAEWAADVDFTDAVHINFNEYIHVTVTNKGAGDMTIRSVALTINWPGMPTYYSVFTGSEVIPAGGTKEFVSEQTRMPVEAEGTYSAFVTIMAVGADGQAVQKQFYGTIDATKFSISAFGIPEEVFVPIVVTVVPILVILIIFRLERAPRWPFVQAVPRFGGHRSRRT
ncbi:MAG: hypothetical protein SA339_09740 [Methanomassiliicoccus sp.]|nr:hypothetical protein [Methanomassiliicoccus sp.]